jgi:hypothetical protein
LEELLHAIAVDARQDTLVATMSSIVTGADATNQASEMKGL